MASRWVRTIEGQLVNLDRCARVYVEQNSQGFALIAFAPGPAHHVLVRVADRRAAEAALDKLAEALDVVDGLEEMDVAAPAT